MKLYNIIAIFTVFAVIECYGQEDINIEKLTKKAEAGNVTAQLELARYYETADMDIEECLPKSLYWYEKAANNNNVDAMMACGEKYCSNLLKGDYNPIDVDFTKGIGWYRKAAKLGNLDAKDAITFYTSKPEQISRSCPEYFGLPFEDDLYYENGDESQTYNCILQNRPVINEEYVKKNPLAAYYLAILSYVKEDYGRAFKYLEDADAFFSNSGKSFNVSFGCTNPFFYDSIEDLLPIKIHTFMGFYYEFGVGCDKDYLRAAKFYNSDDYSLLNVPNEPFLRAAFCYREAGDYDTFIKEVNKDIVICVSHIKEYGRKTPCLQLELAELYKAGEGVEKNPAKALEIYENIVDGRNAHNCLSACFLTPDMVQSENLARAAYLASLMYRNGEGCKADKEMADLYYGIALKYGDRNAWYENQKEYEKR